MRLAFLGTPDAAVCVLRALVEAGHEIVLVVTQPDRRRGRGSSMAPSPVKVYAADLSIPVTHTVADVVGCGAELGVVVAFGKLVKAEVLDALPMVNLHFSLLPRWRGAAPVERAILAGDPDTGVCLMSLDPGLDTGPVHNCVSTPIDPAESAAELRARLADLGAALLLRELDAGLGPSRPQEGEATYAAKLAPDDFLLDFTRPAEEVLRTVRIGRAWTSFRDRRLHVLAARAVPEGPSIGRLEGVVVGCGGGSGLELVTVKPEGKSAQSAEAWRNGARPAAEDQLGAAR